MGGKDFEEERFDPVSGDFGGRMSDFEAIKGYLQRVDRWHDEFAPLVRELLELREARAAAFARAQASPTAAGSKGQERENPAWGTFLRLQAACDRLDAMLLLTPRAAIRAGESATPRSRSWTNGARSMAAMIRSLRWRPAAAGGRRPRCPEIGDATRGAVGPFRLGAEVGSP
jgi:hypothetical protein